MQNNHNEKRSSDFLISQLGPPPPPQNHPKSRFFGVYSQTHPMNLIKLIYVIHLYMIHICVKYQYQPTFLRGVAPPPKWVHRRAIFVNIDLRVLTHRIQNVVLCKLLTSYEVKFSVRRQITSQIFFKKLNFLTTPKNIFFSKTSPTKLKKLTYMCTRGNYLSFCIEYGMSYNLFLRV